MSCPRPCRSRSPRFAPSRSRSPRVCRALAGQALQGSQGRPARRDSGSSCTRSADTSCLRQAPLPLVLMRRLAASREDVDCGKTARQSPCVQNEQPVRPDPLQKPKLFTNDQFLNPQWWLPEVDGVCIGDHQFVQVLGEGTYGRVYKSADAVCGGFNAVKVMSKNRMRSMDDVFGVASECDTLSWLRHPNIVRLWGVVHACRNFYLFMEFAGQSTLHKVLHARDKRAGLELQEARALFHQIADAVAYCHWQGIAHCDLKPQNIVISEDGTPKIVDFGLALKLGCLVGNPRGTWPFTAPEAALPCGKPWDLAKADVWSLGAVLLEMICGADKLFRMLGWMQQTPLSMLRVMELVAFLNTPGALASSLAADIGAASTSIVPVLDCMMYAMPVKRWSASVVATLSW